MTNAAGIYLKLLEARRAKGLTQSELGRILGLPQSYVSQVENGKHDIKVGTLADWARVLDLELMLVPRAYRDSVAYLVQPRSAESAELPPPAYGPLPDEVK